MLHEVGGAGVGGFAHVLPPRKGYRASLGPTTDTFTLNKPTGAWEPRVDRFAWRKWPKTFSADCAGSPCFLMEHGFVEDEVNVGAQGIPDRFNRRLPIIASHT